MAQPEPSSTPRTRRCPRCGAEMVRVRRTGLQRARARRLYRCVAPTCAHEVLTPRPTPRAQRRGRMREVALLLLALAAIVGVSIALSNRPPPETIVE